MIMGNPYAGLLSALQNWGPQYNPLLSLGILILRYPYPDPSKLAEKKLRGPKQFLRSSRFKPFHLEGSQLILSAGEMFFWPPPQRSQCLQNLTGLSTQQKTSRETGKSYMDGKKPCKEFEAVINFRLYGSVLFRCVFCFTPPNRCHSNRSFFGVDTNH